LCLSSKKKDLIAKLLQPGGGQGVCFYDKRRTPNVRCRMAYHNKPREELRIYLRIKERPVTLAPGMDRYMTFSASTASRIIKVCKNTVKQGTINRMCKQ
jgi:hypothetical protein